MEFSVEVIDKFDHREYNITFSDGKNHYKQLLSTNFINKENKKPLMDAIFDDNIIKPYELTMEDNGTYIVADKTGLCICNDIIMDYDKIDYSRFYIHKENCKKFLDLLIEN